MGAVAAPAGPRSPFSAAALRQRSALSAIALATIVVVAAGVRGWALQRQGLWYDEAMTAWLVGETPGQLLAAIPHTESTPPLYYLVAWLWTRIFGDTEAGLRSLSAVAGTLVVPVAFLAARDLLSRRAGLVAAALVATNPLLVWYSQEGRAYSLLALLAAASFWMFARIWREPTALRVAGWTAVSAAALCTHYFAVFVVAPEAAALLANRRIRRPWRVAAAASVLAVATGLAGLAWAQHSHARWQALFPLSVRAEQIPEQVLAGFAPPAGRVAVAIIGIAALVTIVLGVLRGTRNEKRAAAVAGAVAAAAVVVPVGAAVAGVDFVNTRNAIAAVVPLMVALGACASTRRSGGAGLAAATAMAAGSLALVIQVPRTAAAQRPPWRSVAAALAAPFDARRAILVRGSSSWALPLAHYLPRTWWVGPQGVRASQIDVLRKLPLRHSCVRRSWWGASCSIRPRPALKGPPARGFRLVTTHDVGGFSVTIYRSKRPIRLYARPPLERPAASHAPRLHRKLLFSPVLLPRIP